MVTRRLGVILGTVHALEPGRAPSPGWSSPDARLEQLHERLTGLAADALLDGAQARRLITLAGRDVPVEPGTTIVHRDLAPENALLGAGGGLVVIDNTTLDVRAPGYDRARTWYRWPMGARAWAAFRRGYRTRAPLPVRGEMLWHIDVLAEVIAWRREVGVGGIDRALTLLRELGRP